MNSNTSHTKSVLMLALAFMALFFNACRKSSTTTEVAPDYKIDRVIGTYIATDTMLKNNGYPFNVYDTSYDTFNINVSARCSCMVQFDNVLNDGIAYDAQCYKWDTVCTSYEYYTNNTPPSYGYHKSYRVTVRFKGDTMFYNTSNSEDRSMHNGIAIKR